MVLLYTGFENTGLRWRFTTLVARVDSRNTTRMSDRTQNCCFHGPVHTSAKGLKDPEAGEGKCYAGDKLEKAQAVQRPECQGGRARD